MSISIGDSNWNYRHLQKLLATRTLFLHGQIQFLPKGDNEGRISPVSNLKSGRLVEANLVTFSRSDSSWLRSESFKLGMQLKYDKSFIPIMKSRSTSNCGTDGPLCNANWRKCGHLLKIGKTSSIEGPSSPINLISLIFSAGLKSAISWTVT
jgi:hypothetical protein